jgi:hypothetical protein
MAEILLKVALNTIAVTIITGDLSPLSDKCDLSPLSGKGDLSPLSGNGDLSPLSGKGDLGLFWFSCSQRRKLFGFPIFLLVAYLMRVSRNVSRASL